MTNKSKRTIHYHPFQSYQRAQEVVDHFSTDETYLRALVAEVTLERDYAKGLHLTELLEKGTEILNMARRDLEAYQNTISP